MSLVPYSLCESAADLDVPVSTLHQWARPKGAESLLTIFPRAGRAATVPFVGFAEAFVGARSAVPAFRCSAFDRRRLALSAEIGLDHALASQRVYTDGAEVIFDYAEGSR